MAWDENKKIKFTIDHNKVDDTLYDFPVTIKIDNSCGIANVDLTTTSGTTASGTIFDEATSGSSPNYDFTGTDGDPPDRRQWYFSGINAMTYCSIQSNKLNYAATTANDCWIYSNYELVGDFDFQIDFELITHPETNNWSMHFMLTSTGYTTYMIREYGASTNRYRTVFYRLGVNAGGGGTTSRDDITGKIRFVRTGGTIYCYYWTGSWQLMSTSGFSDCTEPQRLVIRPYQDSGPASVECNFDNAQLNSGNVRWTHLRGQMAVFAGGDQYTGTKCFIDIENFDTVNEEIVIHTNVPEISHTENTELYLYYDEDYNINPSYPFNYWACLTPESASDDFAGVSGTAPNTALWYDENAGAYVQNNKLTMDLSSVNPYDEVESTYTFYGDFDVQVDWEISAQPSSDNWYIELGAEEANEDLTDKRWFIRRRYTTADGHIYNSAYSDGGGWTTSNTSTTTTSGSFRLTREDHTVKMYYYNAGWQQLNSGVLTSLDNQPMRIKFVGWTGNNEPTYSVYFSNYTVNKAFMITDNYIAWDNFPESDYSQPNKEKWRQTPRNSKDFIIQDNTLYMDAEGTGGSIYHTHWLDGDFDVQVDYELVNGPSTDEWSAWMRFWGRDNNDDFMTGYAGIRYRASSGGKIYFASFYDNSSWTGETYSVTSDTSGKFRFYRSGNVIYSQYWNGSSWTTLDSEDFDSAPNVCILFDASSWSGDPNLKVKFSNFRFNSARRVAGHIAGASSGMSAQVWDLDYKLVCHLGELYDYPLGGYSNRIYDATLYKDRGAATSNMTYSDKVASQVGGGFDFDGTDDQVTFNSVGTWMEWRWDYPHSLEAVIKADSAGSGVSRAIITNMDVGGTPSYPGWDFRIVGDGRLSAYCITNWSADAIQLYGATPNLHDDEYHYVAVRYDGSKDQDGYTFYYDGRIVPNVNNVNTLTSDTATYNSSPSIGSRDGTNDEFYGVIDEVRATYRFHRSDAYFKASYYSLFDDLLYIDWLQGPQGFDSTKYIQFFVDHRRLDDSLSNFPIRFRISKQSGIDNVDITRIFDELTLTASGTSYPNRKKIAVTTADQTTQCYVEIENWDHDREEANLWIKAPSISPQHQTEFYLYYDSTASDNTDYVGDIGYGQDVWDSNYRGVWHLSQEPTGPSTLYDSTGYVSTGSPINMDSSNRVDSKSGYGIDLNGTDEYISIDGLVSTLANNTKGTISILHKLDIDDDNENSIFSISRDADSNRTELSISVDMRTSQDRMNVSLQQDSVMQWQFRGTLDELDSYVGEWLYLTIRQDGYEPDYLFNGVARVPAVWSSTTDTTKWTKAILTDATNKADTSNVGVFEYNTGTNYGFYDGKVCEVRISDVDRSDAWEKATYHTLLDDLIYFRMPWDDTHSEIKVTVSGSRVTEDLTNFPIALTLASGVGINNEDVTKIFDGLTLSGTLGYSDDFTGWNGDAPSELLWVIEDHYGDEQGTGDIQSNTLEQSAASGSTNREGVKSRFTLSGDFDVSVTYSGISMPGSDGASASLELFDDSDNNPRFHVSRRRTSSNIYYAARYTGSWAAVGSSATSDTDGKLRVTRSGNVLHFYYWNGSSWTELGSGYNYGSAPDLWARLMVHNYTGNPTMTVRWDDFTVSGTVHADQTRKKIAIFSGGNQYTGDKCFVEIENWDAVNETATLHVQVPTLTSGTDADLYFYEDINQPDQNYRLISETNDTFTAASGTSPDATKWAGTALINNNKLRFDRAAGTRTIYSRFLLEDNFDIQIDLDFVDDPETCCWYYYFRVKDPNTDYYTEFEYGYFSQLPGPAQQLGTRFRWYDGSLNDTDAEDGAQTTGKWRLVRIDDTVSGYYDYNGGWTKLDDDTGGSVGTNPVEVLMGITWWTGTPAAVVDMDNFTVTSGTVTGFVGDTGERPAQEVWSEDFVGVWHMAQEPSGADSILDSTTSVIHMTSNNMETTDLIDGQVGKALNFGGTDEYLSEPDNDLLDISGGFTAEVLFSLDSAFDSSDTNDHGLLSRYGSTPAYGDWLIRLESDTGKMKCGWVNSGASWVELDSNKASWDADTWYYIANAASTGGTELTIQKTLDNSDANNTTARDSDDEFLIGAKRGPATPLVGKIDEVRVSSTARSTAWRNATYDSLFDDLVYYDLLEPAPPAPPEPPTPSGLNDAEGCATVNDVLTSGIVVRLYRRQDGSLIGEDTTNASGTWNIPTTYDEYHYAIGLYPVSGTNALIYDWLYPTTVS